MALILQCWRRFPTLSTAAEPDAVRHDPAVLEQAVQHVPCGGFDRLVTAHGADAGLRGFDSRDHFLALLAAALGGHHDQRPTVAALAPYRGALRLMGTKPPARSTFAEADARRRDSLLVALLGVAWGIRTVR